MDAPVFDMTQKAPFSSPVCPCSSYCNQWELCVPIWGTLLYLKHLLCFIIEISTAIETSKPSTATSWLFVYSVGCSVGFSGWASLLCFCGPHIVLGMGCPCSIHAFHGGRWLRVVLDISINYLESQRTFLFSFFHDMALFSENYCLVDKHPASKVHNCWRCNFNYSHQACLGRAIPGRTASTTAAMSRWCWSH